MPQTTRLISIDRDEPDRGVMAEAARILRSGGLVAFATETVYGLGADATNAGAVSRIFEAKGRPAINPLIVHVDSPGMARSCVSAWPAEADALAGRFWPGPLTLVLPRSAIVPDAVTAGLATVGVRMPSAGVARSLIAHAGRPIAAPSANRSTGLSPTLARHVVKDLEGKIDLILDSGPTDLGLESTVLDLSAGRPRLLRPGAITAEALGAVLGIAVVAPSAPPASGTALSSPGQMAVHYAPRTPAVWVEADRLSSVRWPGRGALLVIGHPGLVDVSGPDLRLELCAPEAAARSLYATLHQWDEAGLDRIVIVPPPDRPEWRAVRDRIRRATTPAG